MAPQTKLLSIALMGIAGLAGAAAALLWHRSAVPVELATGTYLAPRRALPDFTLIDQHGQPFGAANLRGSWSFLFFGYTNCPDFCPTTLATLATLQSRLRSTAAAVRPRVIFMSMDATRDTPAQLSAYVPSFDPDFIGITGADQAAVEAAAAKLGVAAVITPQADGNYTVDHSGAIYVIDPDGRVAAILTGPFTVDALAADFKRILAAHA